MTLYVSLFMIPAVLYLCFRFYNISCHLEFTSRKQWTKWATPLLLCSFYLFPLLALLDFYLTGEVELLQYPKLPAYWFWFGLVFVFQLATWVIIADVLKLVSNFFSWDNNQIARLHSQTLFVLSVLIFCFTGWKTYHDTTSIQTQQISLPVEGLPDSLDGFKIVHISDIQGDQYTGKNKIARYIETVNEQHADLIIFTGDLISYGTDFIEMSAQAFGKAEATHGVYAVVGDHDYWAGVEHIRQAYNQKNISLLQDENQAKKINSAQITITGVTEVYSRTADPKMVDSLTSNANNSILKIFASHQVSDQIIRNAQKQDYDLLLAGHTHGGQIHVPFMGMSFSASERETKFISGRYSKEDLLININNGLGFTLAPIRYSAPAEVTVIKLEKNK